MGFIGSTDDIIFSTEPGVKDDSQVFGGGVNRVVLPKIWISQQF